MRAMLLLLMLAFVLPARAEVSELRVAKQYGLGYLQMMMMEEQGLIEKHAKAAGLGDIKVTWATFRSSDVMNDAVISGTVEFVCLGPAGLATIWAKTRGNIDVRGVAAMNAQPNYLNPRNPAVKSITDFTDNDRIALPAVKVAFQALALQMAAAKQWGTANYAKLDHLTVSMAHPDGMAALLSGGGEITAHYTSAPFQYKELAAPGIRKVVDSYEVMGGPYSFNVIAATAKFRAANPKTYAVFLTALQDATDQVNKDKPKAAEAYLRIAKDKSPVSEILAMMNDPQIEFTLVPKRLTKVTDFMHEVGSIKVKPASWKDLFFENAHDQPGS
jgi:NitT/TauT family transport system substrate-binding protein